ncbi:MAG: MoxR family ATPase [Armatimonadetes bacterium]|nr:MoxR family ATPase [Armatimonadota bacterium]
MTARPSPEPDALPASPVDDLTAAERLADGHRALVEQIGRVIVGQREVVDQLLIALFAQGHCLFVGVPGLGKTLLVRTLARALDLSFSRIQFTPDLMPADITGTEIIQENPSTGRREYQFLPGPVFANVILADEINRTPPKTQSALLQAMQELQVTVGGQTYPLPPPLLVLATQNPVEQEGTYPLPEAQLDRFLFSVYLDYPSAAEETRIVLETTSGHAPEVEAVMSRDEILRLQRVVRDAPIGQHVVEYAVRLARATRPREAEAPEFVRQWVQWGAGPRAAQAMVLGAKVKALMDGRLSASRDDVRELALPALRHRIIPSFAAEADGVSSADIARRLVEAVRP